MKTLIERLRSRHMDSKNMIPCALEHEAAAEIDRLRAWIADHGLQTDTCTRYVLGEVCKDCQCKHRKTK